MDKILPSILDVKDLELFLQTINNLNKDLLCNISKMHVDIMDGKFVENKSENLESIKTIKKYNFEADVHLMVKKPLEMAKKIVEFGADAITIHYEIDDFEQALKSLLKEKVKVGISICPETDISVLRPYLEQIDHVLLMSVHPGKGGQTFIEKTYEKIKKIRKFSNIPIIVDGGVNDTNIQKVLNEGATQVVVGSYITKNSDLLKENISNLMKLI